MSNLTNFLSRKKVGLILRVFATKESEIPDRIKMIANMINRANSINLLNRQVISRIDILVWADPKYAGQSDCGKTTEELRIAFPRSQDSNVFISEVKHGDLFCGILNYGIALQSRAGIDYSIIASHEAYSYLNAETISEMVMAANNGSLAIGVAINELTQSVLEGRLANTFCMWHNISLLTVGGFDLRAAKPVNNDLATIIRGYHEKKGEVSYQLAGVEEVIPLARLTETFGACLAPILPQGEGVQKYQTPNPAKDYDLWLRHVSKMGTKLERQSALLAMIGFDLSYLIGGVMENYRNQ